MANIKINQLVGEITKELSQYSREVVEKVNISSEHVGQAAVKQLKATSPKMTGDYARSWTMTTERGTVAQPSRRIIHNRAPEYRLTHLLENGHVKAGGGRVPGIPHIRPAEQQVIEQFMQEVEEAIGNG